MMDSGLQTFNNFILIAGTGRNAGKTMLACKIIQNLSETLPVIAVKISGHFHPTEKGQKIIVENSDYRILEESLNTHKDSSRMKKAGAKISYYIQSKQEHLFEAVMNLPFDVKSGPVICESGGLHHYIKPGLFFLVEGDTIPANKTTALQFNPIRVKFNNGNFNINLQNLRFKNNCFTFNNCIDEQGLKYCFGLSGNPVSSFVQFEFFVKPFLFNYLGSNGMLLRYKGVLKQDFFRKNGTRFGVFPVKIDENNRIEETVFHGSAHINALPNANALMEVPEGITHLKKGEEAYVRRI